MEHRESNHHSGKRFLTTVIESCSRLGRHILDVVKRVWNDAQHDDCIDLAAQMAFYFVLSLFPFLIVMGSVVGWLPSTDLWPNMAQWLTNYLPPRPRRVVFEAILGLTQNNTQYFSFGLTVTIWVASSGFVSLMESLSLAYGFPETRGFWRKRFIAVGATLVGTAFAIVSFVLLTFGHVAAEAISPYLARAVPFPLPWELARWLVTLVLILLGLALMNYFLPNVKQRWHWLTPGSIFSALSFAGMSEGFNFYLRHFGSYPRFYGTMAGFVILVTWIYMASLILLVGAEVNSVMERLHRQGAVA
jgi:membrane protein